MEKNDYEALRQRNISERNNVVSISFLYFAIKMTNNLQKNSGKNYMYFVKNFYDNNNVVVACEIIW